MIRLSLLSVVLAGAAADPARIAPAPYKVLSVSQQFVAATPRPVPEAVVQSGHVHAVQALAFSPDNTLLATASNDSTVKLWDIRLGREIRTLLGSRAPLHTVAFRPDGRQLAAAGSDQVVHIWDVSTGNAIASLRGHNASIAKIAFSPNGRMLASGGTDKVLVLWDLESGVPQHVRDHDGAVRQVAWAPDGRQMASVSGKKVSLWDPASGKELHTISFKTDELGRVAFSPDGNYLAFTLAATTGMITLPSRQLLRAFPGTFLGYQGNGETLCTLESVGSVGRYKIKTGDLVASFRTKDAPDAKTVREVYKQWSPFAADFPRWNAPGEASVLSPNGNLLAGATERGTASIWDMRNGGLVQRLGERIGVNYGQGGGALMRPLTIACSPTAPVLAIGETDFVRIVDFRTGVAPRLLAGHHGLVSALAFRPDGKVLATGGFHDHTVCLWDVATGDNLAKLPFDQEMDGVERLAYAPDGNTFASGHWHALEHGENIILWDTRTGKVQRTLRDSGNARRSGRMLARASKISGLAFSLDGKMLLNTHQFDNRFSLWDIKSGEHQSALVGQPTLLNGLALSSDGQTAALAKGMHQVGSLFEGLPTEDIIILFNLKTGKLLHRLAGHTGQVHTVAFSPDGKLVASGSADTTVMLWDTARGTRLAKLTGHTADVGSLAFSHDGRHLVSGGYDQSVRIWDVAQRRLVAVYVAFGREDYVMVRPDNYYAASRQGLRGVAFRQGKRAVPFEQYDLRLNRPDIVLEGLGYASPELAQSYRHAYEKRLNKMHVRSEMLKPDYNLPKVELLAAPPLSTTERVLTFRVRATDSSHRLERLLVYINDVPVWGSAGADLRAHRAAALDLELAVELSAGANKVQVSALNDQGAESLPETFTIACQVPERKPDLYLVAVGVSDYQDGRLRLAYADKDARDVADLFAGKRASFAEIKELRLLNRDATREKILQTRDFLNTSRIDDEVIVFFAGHGLLDKKLDYYFGTADIDFREPSKRGLPYESLEGLLDGIPARKKLLLMDTCHAGELDKDDLAAAAIHVPNIGTITARNFRGLELVKTRRLGLGNTQRLLQELFADLRRGTGAVVIASAGGAEYAIESEAWHNGVFTHALLRGLKGEAGRDKDQRVHVSKLRDFVQQEVRRLTRGRQMPTARRENLELDFAID